MSKILEKKIRRGTARIEVIEGVVANQQQQRWTETDVQVIGGGGTIGPEGGTIAPPIIQTTHHNYHQNEFWIVEPSGTQRQITLLNSGFGVAPGHHVRIAVSAMRRTEGEGLFAENVTAGTLCALQKGSWFKWARRNGLAGMPWLYKLIVRGIPLALLLTFMFFLPNMAEAADSAIEIQRAQRFSQLREADSDSSLSRENPAPEASLDDDEELVDKDELPLGARAKSSHSHGDTTLGLPKGAPTAPASARIKNITQQAILSNPTPKFSTSSISDSGNPFDNEFERAVDGFRQFVAKKFNVGTAVKGWIDFVHSEPTKYPKEGTLARLIKDGKVITGVVMTSLFLWLFLEVAGFVCFGWIYRMMVGESVKKEFAAWFVHAR